MYEHVNISEFKDHYTLRELFRRNFDNPFDAVNVFGVNFHVHGISLDGKSAFASMESTGRAILLRAEKQIWKFLDDSAMLS